MKLFAQPMKYGPFQHYSTWIIQVKVNSILALKRNQLIGRKPRFGFAIQQKSRLENAVVQQNNT